MRVVFNGLSGFRPRTGVGAYVTNLLAELRLLAGADEVTLYPHGWLASAATFAGKLLAQKQRAGGAVTALASPASVRQAASRLVRECGHAFFRRGFRSFCRRERFDLYHEPNFIPWPSDVPTVVTVHDLSVILHPQWHPPDRVAYHERHFRRRLAQCRHIFTDSACIRSEVIQEIGMSPEHVTAIPIGVRADMQAVPRERLRAALNRLGLPEDYLLFVGAIEPRKNVLTLLRAYCDLPSHLRRRCPLVLVGPWGWNYETVREYFETTARPAGAIHLGYLPDADLPAVYSAARALAYPSFYEGFGLPPVEMMACGGAVLASTTPAHREVLGDRAHFIDPHDLQGWRDALARIIVDDHWRDALRSGVVDHARRYSWRRCAERTRAAYQRLVKAA